MFKLVAVGGKLRGKEFLLEENAENIFGRSSDVNHQLNIEGVSKKHMSITVNNDTAFLEDLGSSNGTFVNGNLVRKLTLKGGEKITLPNLILEVVYVREKKVIVTKKVAKTSEGQEDIDLHEEVAPKDLIGRLKYFFRKKIMTILYGFNEKYEWRVMMAVLLFIFIVINISLTIGPVLLDARKLLVYEIAERGAQYAKEVARANSSALGMGDLSKVNTSFLESDAQGVQGYELIDLEGRIVRPYSKQNAYTQDPFTVEAINFFKNIENQNKNFIQLVGEGEIGIARAIMQINAIRGSEEVVGIISIRFKPKSLKAEAAQSTSAYLESLVITAIVGVFFFGFIYYLTTKPLFEMKSQIEDVLRGKKKELESKHLMSEISPLRNTLNSILQRIKELQSDGSSEFAEIEDDSSYVSTLKEFMQGAQGPVMILNSEKNIQYLNSEAEDLTGMRESAASGTSLLDSARDQGFAATVIDLCDQSSNNGGSNQSENYELTGKNYAIHVSSLIGKDNFSKAFYITFVLDS